MGFIRDGFNVHYNSRFIRSQFKPPQIKPSQEQILRMHTSTNMQMFENIPIFVCFGFSRNFLVHRISHKISAVYVIGFRDFPLFDNKTTHVEITLNFENSCLVLLV